MRNNKTNYLFCICLILIIVSCSNDNNNVNTIPNHIYTNKSFPLKVGNWWRYKVYDDNGVDTCIFKIVSDSVSNNNHYYLCTAKCRIIEKIDTTQFILNDTSLIYKSFRIDGYAIIPEFSLKLPFSSGDTWHGRFPIDSSTVASYDTNYKILGKSYDIFFINRIAFGDRSYYNIQSIQLSENIGIISESIKIRSIYINELKDIFLIDYHLE